MALPLCEQPPTRFAPTLVSKVPAHQQSPSPAPRSPSAACWLRRALAAAGLLLFLWLSSLLAGQFQGALTLDDPAMLSRPAAPQASPGYVIVGDTALPIIEPGND
ncbi:hypothetical protein [Candidatus Poriferisocius sp.]|uniref:hypothetical protein n=1 Tax=Candidatus Poriferisocius sp. TaxID=3101276 RepID=UPI003B0255FB